VGQNDFFFPQRTVVFQLLRHPVVVQLIQRIVAVRVEWWRMCATCAVCPNTNTALSTVNTGAPAYLKVLSFLMMSEERNIWNMFKFSCGPEWFFFFSPAYCGFPTFKTPCGCSAYSAHCSCPRRLLTYVCNMCRVSQHKHCTVHCQQSPVSWSNAAQGLQPCG